MECPTLHCGIGNFPRLATTVAGPGRFPGYDERFERTETVSAFNSHHVYADLFGPRSLDRLLNPTLDTWREVQGDIETVAAKVLDGWAAHYGFGGPDRPLTIFLGLERATLERSRGVDAEPYVTERYGERDVRMMDMLCNRVRFVAMRRGWPVDAAPYHPIRSTGYVSSRPGSIFTPMPADFTARHGAWRVGPLLRRDHVWVHGYCSDSPATLAAAGTTYAGFIAQQLWHAERECGIAGARPDHVWLALWLYSGIYGENMAAIFEGARRGFAFWADRGVRTHVVVNGDWHLLGGLVDAPVTGLASVGPEQACEALVTAWNRDVVPEFDRVFPRDVASG